jgi:hypothetical protein
MRHILNISGPVCRGAMAAVLAGAPAALAQEHIPAKVEIAWNRYYDMPEVERQLHALAEAYPELVELRSIGKSWEGRDMWVAIVNSPGTGPHQSKPAMWIDGSIHANEIQATEVVMYSIWYLLKAYGANKQLTELLDNYSFYFCPVVSPDSRAAWFRDPATPHYPRHHRKPQDYDRDGQTNEDPHTDLDGDGSITQMWKPDERGEWIRDRFDPRIFRRVPPGETGDWTFLGQEGVDIDGDGRDSEDGPGGFDMNRNWPSDWQPEYVQGGAGEFPFSTPETRSIGLFILAHPNIVAGQSYHNTGGMILRGPGAAHRENMYFGTDRRIYDELGREGEKILPHYRYLVIHKDLYRVHGGEVNWLAEGRGIFAFTNELWAGEKYFQRDSTPANEENMRFFRDKLQFGQAFKEYTWVEHPRHGRVLVGGLNKWSSRSTPTFMLEEESHRNFAFTMFHADQMPLLSFDRVEAVRLAGGEEGAGLWRITAEIRNRKLMPTRSALQRQKKIGASDLFITEPPAGGRVVAAGTLETWWAQQMKEARFEPHRIQVDQGVPGRGTTILRVLVTGAPGDEVVLRYISERARDIDMSVRLGAEP